MNTCFKTPLLTALVALAVLPLQAAPAKLTIELDKPGHAISPLLYGIFFEDINCSADGGLYAELVRNRSFEDASEPANWSVVQSGAASVELSVDSTRPVSAKNPHSLKVQITGASSAGAGVANSGYWGMAVQKGGVYELSLFARGAAGFRGPLRASLESSGGRVYAETRIPALEADWKSYQRTLKASDTDPKARLVITAAAPGTFWLDMVSLFPKQTWKHRPNGLRPDLAEMLAAMKPGFVRFPGGCWVEGDTMAAAYRWKQTIGDISERRTQHNLWQYEATHGLGYHEYLQLCEDLGAEPLFVINCGMSHRENVPMAQMQEYVQDALDAIEYANGPATSTWGALRAKHGHRAPFHLAYMEIGNENGGPAYHERYALFHDAIKAKHPQMHLVADEWNGSPKNRAIEIIDEHYYSSAEFFSHNAGKYDSYDRAGRKVYVGEYACTKGCGQGNLRAALGEAAFMTGLERNSDVVVMASYAPLFANIHYKKWNPDLINFDSARAYGLPSYYVQQMFSAHRGDFVLPVTLEATATAPSRSGGIGVGTWRTQAEFKELSVTRGGETLFSSDFLSTNGWDLRGGQWSVADGALCQQSPAENVRAFIGDQHWTDYTYRLKARKTGGAEGFLISFLVQDREATAWWNIGGWGNSKHRLDMDGVIGKDVPGSIETGRWYDVRIEVKGASIRCYLDGQLIHEAELTAAQPLYATASRSRQDHEVIVKVVNVSPLAQATELQLQGAKVSPRAEVIVLASDRPEDENTLDQPVRVAPVTHTFNGAGPRFDYVFPANSVTVMRLHAR